MQHILSRHLIADHLGWFEDSTGQGKMRTVEDILAAKGEKVRRGVLQPSLGNLTQTVEYVPEE